MSCAVLTLLSLLAFAAGCSATDGSELEVLDSTSEAQSTCGCPENTPCVTYTCNKLTCVATAAKDGTTCEDKAGGFRGRCLESLCCPGCVVRAKVGTSSCARKEGTDVAQCGVSGEYCENCANDSCQVGACEKKACVRTPVADGDACIDTSGGCYKGSCCKGCLDDKGACQPGGALNACGVSDSKLVRCQNCMDDKACTAEACVSGACQYPEAGPGTSCSDGDLCNGTEECSGTSCKAGKALNCDDGNPCTEDSCDATKGCQHTALTGKDCSDGDACTTGDKCGSDGLCKSGTQIKCDDGEFCTTDSCEGGNCVYKPKPTTTTCDDGNTCTLGDKCTAAGKCAGTNPNIDFHCDDGNPCTIDAQPDCSVKQCTHTPAAATVACPADACHQGGHCSGVDDKCVQGEVKDCSDKLDCTKDTCDPVSGCKNTNDASADCSDGDPCTENDVCVAGVCGGKPKTCLALDACHDAGECNTKTGKCDDPRADDGKACPGGSCESGACVLDPNAGVGGEGAGGAADGAGGAADGTGGAGVVGGAPTSPEGEGGEPQQPPSGGTGGSSVEEPARPFVRKPEGCSCRVPAGGNERPLALVGLAVVAGAALRRSRRGRQAA